MKYTCLVWLQFCPSRAIWLDFCMKVNLYGNKDKIENLIFLKKWSSDKERKKKKSIMKIDIRIGKNAKHVLQTLPLKIEMFSFLRAHHYYKVIKKS